MKPLFVLAALALFGCSDVNAPTSRAPKSLGPRIAGDMIANDMTLYEFSVNLCNGETVALTGNLHFMYQVTTPASGSYHVRVTNDYTFSGVGLVTGAKYEGGAKFVDKEIFNQGAATVFKVEASARLISQGNIPNLWLDVGTAFTIDANGNVTHEGSVFSVTCR